MIGVGDVRPVRHEPRRRRIDRGLQLGSDPVVGRLGVGVHPGDRRAGDDVVELVEQHLLPRGVERIDDVDRHRPARGPPQLGLAQEPLAPTVADLGARLAGQRAAVHLEVQLAVPHRDRGTSRGLGLDRVEELRHRAQPHLRQPVEIRHPVGPAEHLPGGTTATVAVAVGHQAPVAPGVLAEVALGVAHLLGRDHRVVGVDRREVGEHLAAVEATPAERRVREAVLLVPAELLGDEAVAPAGAEDLRRGGRVAEHVGDPNLGAAHTEARLEVALAVHQLAHQALPARQVHVGLDPHPADRLPLPAGDLGGDPLEQLRGAFLDPRVLRRLRAREAVVGVVVHQAHRRGERAQALALRLAQRPQPGGVDVGVADRDDAVRAVAGPQRQGRSEE